jgi:hypothetical protein
MKPETQKQLSISAKIFKAADAYLAQHRKLAEAFTILEAEKEKTEKEHKDFLATAGNLEASRLLGEVTGDDSRNLDSSLMKVRDQQDRLVAAKNALEARKKALFDQLETQAGAANQSLGDLAKMVERDLDEELVQIVQEVMAVVNRYYALYSGSRYISLYKREVFEMNIPSLINGENLFKAPVRHHVRTHEVLSSTWNNDPEAVRLHEQLQGLGQTNLILQRMEKDMLDAGVAA